METIESLVTYQANKEYAIKQARTARNDKAATEPSPTLDSATKDSSHGGRLPQGAQPQYTPEEAEQWMMFMKGGGKGEGKKGSKGTCFSCGEPGHFAR